MKLTRLRIKIEPRYKSEMTKELWIEVTTDRTTHTVMEPIDDNDFECLFDAVMRYATEAIKKAVKQP